MASDQYGDPLPAGAVARLGTIRFGPGEGISALAFAPDSKTLASGGEDCSVRIWNAANGKELRRFGQHADKVSALTFSGDGTIVASGSRDGAIRFWDVERGGELGGLPGHRGTVFALAVAGDGEALVSAGADGVIRFWDLESGKETWQLGGDWGPVHAIAFSPDGKLLATGSWENTVRLYDFASSKVLRQCAGHRNWVQAIAFSPDGRALVSGSGDETIRLWEVSSCKERSSFRGHREGGILSLAFAPDGKTFASAGADTTILVWNVACATPDLSKPAALSSKQLQGWWNDLGDDSAVKAYQAMCALAAAGKHAVPFLKTQLPMLAPPNPQRLAVSIRDLDHDQFATREKATLELERIGALAEPAVRAALQKQNSIEARRRLERIIDKINGPVPSPDTLHALRVVETLERIGSAEARQLLEGIGRQTPATIFTSDARAALLRLAHGAAGS